MKKNWLPFLLSIIIIAVQIIYALSVNSLIANPADRGTFGDMFGGITALFSGLAFAGMIYAIILQSNELSLQREELKLTREEMTASRIEQEKIANAQINSLENQLLAAQIQGMAAIVQGKYQLASAYGANAQSHSQEALKAQEILVDLMDKAGGKNIKEELNNA